VPLRGASRTVRAALIASHPSSAASNVPTEPLVVAVDYSMSVTAIASTSTSGSKNAGLSGAWVPSQVPQLNQYIITAFKC
jgi:hypothetical protein